VKTVYLVSLNRERVDSVYPVRVREQWDPAEGPYSDHVPFAVGSNQYLVDQDDLSDEQLRALGDPLEAHGLYRTYLEEFEGGTDQDLCEYVHATVDRVEDHDLLRLVWRSATDDERWEFEHEEHVRPGDPDLYRGYLVACSRLIAYIRKNRKPKETERMKVARDKPKDYNRIHYYMDANHNIWHGPFCPDDTLHYKQVDSDVIRHSDLPPEAVEITPYQAAQEIRHRQERLAAVTPKKEFKNVPGE